MPTKLNIPSRTENHCEPCEHHKCTAMLCTRIGPGGWREYVCKHPDAFPPLPKDTDPEKARIIGKLEALQTEGRHIGRTEKQPDWCPLKREPANVRISGTPKIYDYKR